MYTNSRLTAGSHRLSVLVLHILGSTARFILEQYIDSHARSFASLIRSVEEAERQSMHFCQLLQCDIPEIVVEEDRRKRRVITVLQPQVRHLLQTSRYDLSCHRQTEFWTFAHANS